MVHLMFSAKRNNRFGISCRLVGRGLRRPSVHSKVNYNNLLGPISTFSIFKDNTLLSLETVSRPPFQCLTLIMENFFFLTLNLNFTFQFMFILFHPFTIYLLEETVSMFSVLSHQVAEDNSKVPHKSSFLRPEHTSFFQLLLQSYAPAPKSLWQPST